MATTSRSVASAPAASIQSYEKKERPENAEALMRQGKKVLEELSR